MKYCALFVLAAVPVGALASDPVSAFDFNGTLAPSINNNGPFVSPLVHLNGGANPTPTSSTYSNATVGSTNKQVLNFAFADTLHAFHGIGANGGGAYVNQYTILMDVKFNSQPNGAFASLFNTAANNGSSDGDSFLQWGAGNQASIGIQGTYGGSFTGDVWHRLGIAVQTFFDGTELDFYLDGALVNQRIDRPGGQPIDGRFSLYTYNDSDPADDGVYILGDNDGDNGSGQISLLAFYDHRLTAGEIQSLGAVGQPVPEPATLVTLGLAGAALLRRRRRS